MVSNRMTSVIQPIDRTEQNMDRDLALLTLSPDQLGRRIGLAFNRDEDDLGGLSYLLFRVGDNDFLLERHDEGPAAGTVLRGADTPMSGGVARRFMQAVSALGIVDSEIAWRTPLASWRWRSPARRLRLNPPPERRLHAAG